jgi:hypothetical protein
MTYTRRCTGDLGISYRGSVVAQVFYVAKTGYPFHVYDIRRGGVPHMHASLTSALDDMQAIVDEHIARIDEILAE